MRESTEASGAGRTGEATLPGAPPPARTWPTRAELLRDRAAALVLLHRADMRMRTMLGAGFLVVAAAACSAASSLGFVSDVETGERAIGNGGAIAMAVVLGPAGLALSWWALRRTLRAREIGPLRRLWEDLADTPAALALPPGDLTHDLRDLFDARTEEDGARYIFETRHNMYGHALRTGSWRARLGPACSSCPA